MLIAASGSLRGCLLEGSAVPVVGDAGYILVLRCRESETSDLESKLSKEQAIHLLNFGSSCVWISVFYSDSNTTARLNFPFCETQPVVSRPFFQPFEAQTHGRAEAR